MQNSEWVSQLHEFVLSDYLNGVNSKSVEYANRLCDGLIELRDTELSEEDVTLLESIMNINDPIYVLYWMSVLSELTKSNRLYSALTKYAFEKRNDLPMDSQYFLYSHLGAMSFRNSFIQARDVLLINTAEVLTQSGSIPFFCYSANYIERFSEQSFYEYKGLKIPFFQCPNIMPDVEVLQALLEIVGEEKPGFIISLGDTVFSHLADKIVPVYTIGLQADMPHKFTKYRSVYKDLTDEDVQWLEWSGYNADSLIRTRFAFSLPAQNVKYTRKDLGIPDDVFCMTVVGNRLDQELTDDYLIALEKIIGMTDSYVCFVGGFDYNLLLKRFPLFAQKSCWIKYADELLAVMENCDLYVNPKRKGGGTSALFAMHHGKPVVTVDFCDVALNAGKEFCVKDYEAMISQIEKYINDPEYYEEMGKLAKVRSDELSDADRIMIAQINELERREGF